MSAKAGRAPAPRAALPRPASRLAVWCKIKTAMPRSAQSQQTALARLPNTREEGDVPCRQHSFPKPGDSGAVLMRGQEIDAADWFQVHSVTSKWIAPRPFRSAT